MQICKSGEYIFSNEDVQLCSDIQTYYEENFDEIRRVYQDRDIKAELALVIGKITDSNHIEEATDGKEAINMCTALKT